MIISYIFDISPILMIPSFPTAALSVSVFLGGIFVSPATASNYNLEAPSLEQSSNRLISSFGADFASPSKYNTIASVDTNKSVFSSNLIENDSDSRDFDLMESSIFNVAGYTIICSQSRPSTQKSIVNDRCMPYDASQKIKISSLGSLVQQAISFSPLLEQAQAKIKSNLATVRAQFSSWYPQLSISSGSLLYTNIINTQNYGSASTSTNPSASGTAFQPVDPVSTTSQTSTESSGIGDPVTKYASYTQAYPIFTVEWAFLDPSRADKINAAKSKLDASKLEYIESNRTVASQIIQLTGELIALEHHISGLLIELVAAQNIERLYRDNVNLGNSPMNILTAQESVVALLEYQIIELLTKHQQHTAQLSILTNQKPSNIFVVDYFQDDFLWPYSEEETFELIIQSPSIEKDLALSQNYKDLAAATLKENLPKLSMLGYVSYVGTLGSQEYGPPEPPSGAWSSQLSNYIGVNLTWNIFDGFSNYNTASAYKASAEAMSFKRQQDILEAKETAINSLRLLANARSMRSALSDGLNTARESLNVTLQRIEIGYEDPTSTYASQKQISQALVQYSSVYLSVVQAFSQLFILTGVSPYDVLDIDYSNQG